MKKNFCFFVLVFFLSGCSFFFRSVQVVKLPSQEDIFVTSGDISVSYEPIGFIRVKKYGFKLFWYVTIVGVDFDETINKFLMKKAREMGAEGIINVEYKYSVSPSIIYEQIAVIGTIVPSVTATGLAVKLKPEKKEEPGFLKK